MNSFRLSGTAYEHEETTMDGDCDTDDVEKPVKYRGDFQWVYPSSPRVDAHVSTQSKKVFAAHAIKLGISALTLSEATVCCQSNLPTCVLKCQRKSVGKPHA